MRRMVWVEKEGFGAVGVAPSARGVFKHSEWPTGKSLTEITEKYQQQCNTEFSSRVCGPITQRVLLSLRVLNSSVGRLRYWTLAPPSPDYE